MKRPPTLPTGAPKSLAKRFPKAPASEKLRARKGKPPGRRPKRVHAEIEQAMAEVERLMAARTPRLEIVAKTGLPARTVAEYQRRIRIQWVEAQAASRPELIAETVERIVSVAKTAKGSERVAAERLLAEVRGLVGSGLSVRVGLAQTTVIQAPTYDYMLLNPEEQVVLRELLLKATVNRDALPPGGIDDGSDGGGAGG